MEKFKTKSVRILAFLIVAGTLAACGSEKVQSDRAMSCTQGPVHVQGENVIGASNCSKALLQFVNDGEQAPKVTCVVRVIKKVANDRETESLETVSFEMYPHSEIKLPVLAEQGSVRIVKIESLTVQ